MTDDFGLVDPWLMPRSGMQYCECGQGCEVDRELVDEVLAEYGFGSADQVPHSTVITVCADIWGYDEVCDFFLDHVNLSARRVDGHVLESYPYGVAVDMVGYFSKTWQGCPEECL